MYLCPEHLYQCTSNVLGEWLLFEAVLKPTFCGHQGADTRNVLRHRISTV